MAGLTTSLPKLLASRSAYLKGVMLDEIKQAAEEWKQFFNVETMDDYSEVYEMMTGFGLNQEIESEIPASWPQDDITQRFEKTFTQVWYGLGTTVSKKFVKYDKDGVKTYMRGRGLVKSANNTQEWYASSVFNNTTSMGAAYVGHDAKAMGATDHGLLRNLLGATASYSNIVSATLDHDSLASAITKMIRTPDDQGLPSTFQPSKMWLSPALIHTAREILGSEMRSDTAENTTNVLRQYGIRPIPWGWITSDTAWGLQAANHDLHWKTGQGVEVEVYRNPDNKSIKADVDQMFTFGLKDWRGQVVGNT